MMTPLVVLCSARCIPHPGHGSNDWLSHPVAPSSGVNSTCRPPCVCVCVCVVVMAADRLLPRVSKRMLAKCGTMEQGSLSINTCMPTVQGIVTMSLCLGVCQRRHNLAARDCNIRSVSGGAADSQHTRSISLCSRASPQQLRERERERERLRR